MENGGVFPNANLLFLSTVNPQRDASKRTPTTVPRTKKVRMHFCFSVDAKKPYIYMYEIEVQKRNN